MSSKESDVDIIKPRKTKTEEADLDITPMIDITFLLLAFFVVVSKMDAQPPISMPTANSGTSVAEENCAVIVITVETPGGTAKIFKGQTLEPSTQVAVGTKDEMEDEIAEYLQNEISNQPTIEAVLIKASGDARSGDVETIKQGIIKSELALERLSLIHI